MKHLFIIRHGDYEFEDLSRQGIEETEALAKEMKAIVGEMYNGHYLLSSTAPRAQQTAEIIAKAFGLETFNKNEKLHTRGNYDLNREELMAIDEMIAEPKENHDIVTITTHYEVVGSYPRHAIKTLLGREEKPNRPKTGEGIHINLETNTYQTFPRKS